MRILVEDPDRSRREAIERLLSQLGLRCDCQLPGANIGPQTGAVIWFVGSSPLECNARLPELRALRLRGTHVIPYGPCVGAWELRELARILVACGMSPLDSAAPDFEARLASAVADAHGSATRRFAERRRVLEVMNRLQVVGNSEALVAVFRWVTRVAPLSDVPALITGQTGTGKELVGRAVHALDPKRACGPFVAVNCAAISPHLAEAELFGHRRGAFTGADRDRRGLFRAAHDGVLFLDEIGELDLALQAKLLRVLQEGRVLGVGEDRETAVSVRVLAATNRDLPVLVRRGMFRDDLFHRLNAAAVEIPPLSERPEDVLPLARHILALHRRCSTSVVHDVNTEFADALLASGLPGNVRQIENAVRGALIRRDTDGPLGLGDLPDEVCRELLAAPPAPAPHPMAAEQRSGTTALIVRAVAEPCGWNLARSIRACERSLLEAALAQTDGCQSRAARLLGVTPRSVYNLMRRHGLADRRSA